jgi:hypothetical protein
MAASRPCEVLADWTAVIEGGGARGRPGGSEDECQAWAEPRGAPPLLFQP